MAVALLDTDVLLALAWPNHLHHEAAHEWLARRRGQRWATCLLTELAFVRLSSQPAVVKTAITTAEAWQILDVNLGAENHEFWPLESSMSDLLPELRQRVMGHHQLADAVLLDLAIRRTGRLATFDRRVENLLPPGSDYRWAIEILKAE
jgi:uncharacterized protein